MIRTLSARLMAAVIGLGLIASPAPAQAARWVESYGADCSVIQPAM